MALYGQIGDQASYVSLSHKFTLNSKGQFTGQCFFAWKLKFNVTLCSILNFKNHNVVPNEKNVALYCGK
jgi:hypothetical protein